MSESCLRDTRGTSKSFLSKKSLNIVEESRRATLEEKTGQYRELKDEAGRAEKRDEEAQVRVICERVESHLWSTDSRTATEELGRCVPLGPRPAVLH